MKILIVDDDSPSREVLHKIISTCGDLQLSAVADAKSAWALLDDPSRYFDVVFLDLSMPEVDGLELFGQIKRNPLLNSVEVVICTGSTDRATAGKAVQLGARHYLAKPCSREVVLAKLNQIRPPEPAAGIQLSSSKHDPRRRVAAAS